jgi:hypothetical protein
MYEYFWEYLLPYLQRAKRTFATPYTWDSKGQRFTLIRSIPYVRRFRNLSILTALHLLLIWYNLYQTLRNETNILLKIYSLGYAGITSAITVVRWMHQSLAAEIVPFLNATVAFQNSTARPGTYEWVLSMRNE